MQKSDFLSQLFNPVRAKILRFFALHDTEELRAAEVGRRTGVSTPAAEKELIALVKIGVLKAQKGEGLPTLPRRQAGGRQRKTTHERMVRYAFDDKFRYANALSTFIHECSPERYSDVEKALRSIGRLNTIVLSGVFIGDAQRPADLLVVGDFVNEKRLEKAVRSFEPKYGREIRYAVFSTPEFRYRLTIHDKLLRDTLDYPHRVLLNKGNVL